MEALAEVEPGDINSPHFEYIFWDICDPLVHYIPFDFGNERPRKPWGSSGAVPVQKPMRISRSNNGIIDLSAQGSVSLAVEATRWSGSQGILSPIIDYDQELPKSVNPVYGAPYPSCLQELSTPQFSTSSSFVRTPPQTFHSSNDVHTLPYNDMSPAEILASIPQYGSATVPMSTIKYGLEDELFPDETVATSTLQSPDTRVELSGNDQSDDESPQTKTNTNIPDTVKSRSRAADPIVSEGGRKEPLSSTTISNLTHAFSSEISSDNISCSSYSDNSVEQESTEELHLQDNTPLTEPKNETKHSIANEVEPPKYSCFCGDVDDDMMIACEGDHGESELWFHYQCAGINVVPDDSWYCSDCHRAIEEHVTALRRPQSSSRSNTERLESSVDQRKKALPWSKEEDLACIDAVQEAIVVKGKMGIEKLAPYVVNKLRVHGFERSSAAVKLQWNRRLRADSQLDERRFANPHKMRTSVMKRKQSFSDDICKTKRHKITELSKDQICQKINESDSKQATSLLASDGSSLKRNKLDTSSNDISYSQVATLHRPGAETITCQAGSSSQASEHWDEKQIERNHNFIVKSS